MQNIILCGRDGRPSMRNVYSKMTDRTSKLVIRRMLTSGKIYRVHSDNNSERKIKVVSPSFRECRKIIRWGTQEVLDGITDNNTIVYNKANILKLISNKYESRLALERAGVNVPLNVTDRTDSDLLEFPIIARPFHHSKGKNFIVLENKQKLLNHYRANHTGWYYSNFVNKVKEFRVHCAHGRILNFLEKPNPGAGQIAWNRAQNHQAFENVRWNEYNFNVALEALKACRAIGADFAGVDVLLDKKGKAWVLELNSSPTLNSSEYSCKRYAAYFQLLFQSPQRLEHCDFMRFTNPSSFAWKEDQLAGRASHL